jgi:glycosyltransferase involved in cell wall biosynthesis
VLATILITNYNYGRYLPEALESALAQTHPDVEVIVVDDGSTDDSHRILEGYGDRIRVLLKENAGMAAAVNDGYAMSRGDVVCFLDADDVFLPGKVAAVVAACRPGVSVVYHPLQAMRTDGTPFAKPTPRSVLRGEIRRAAERSGGWWPRPLTTGLAFPRAFLDRVMPMPVPEPPLRLWPDTYLADAAPFHGPVAGIPHALARNRIHERNSWTLASITGGDDAEVVRRRLEQVRFEFEVLERSLGRMGVAARLSISDHPEYQQHRWAAGEARTRARALATWIRCPTLPWPMKWRQLARVVLRRW